MIKWGMLVLDAFKDRLTSEFKSVMNADLLVIPGGMSSQLHILDVVNIPFKDHLKQLYSK